ncbi:MAG: DUF882 domain-containing protein [Deltaproteobacteria bacterium]|nr:MAG: DUF882 domain-containing protein [Deltaproteobacteria bacterium]
MRILPLLLTLVACYRANDVRQAPLDTGPEGEAEFDLPTEDTSSDTGEPGTEDTGTVVDTDEPDPVLTGDEACYLGPNRDDGVCLPVGAPQPMPQGYVYPEPMNGSAQYLAPLAFLDLDVEDPGLALAPNFVLEEFGQAWKGRYAVVQPHAVERVQDLRDELGPLIVNSGYRNPDYNAGIGGATWSRHMYGDAFDLDPVSVDLATLEAACRAHGAGYVGVYTTHIHCDWRNDPLSIPFYGGARGQVHTTPLPALDARIARDGRALRAPATGWDEGEPLREWRAYSAEGAILERATGEQFTFPAGAARVEVTVGRALTRSIRVD